MVTYNGNLQCRLHAYYKHNNRRHDNYSLQFQNGLKTVYAVSSYGKITYSD